MEMPPPEVQKGAAAAPPGDVPNAPPNASEPSDNAAKKPPPASDRLPSIIVGVVVAAVTGLSIWYLVRPQPLLVQGEVDATRLDIAARVDGRVAEIPVVRGQNVAAGAVLVRIDNPETIAKHEQTLAAKIVAEAQLANINAGTRGGDRGAQSRARARASGRGIGAKDL
jgi:HlyD family secretion protein